MALPVALAHAPRQRSEAARADLPPVRLGDREDAAGGAAEECFFGGVEIEGCQVALGGRNAEFRGDLEDRFAG